MPWQCVALVLQRLHRGSLQLAAAAPLQPFLMMVKSLTSRICSSHGYYISFEPVPPELRWLFVSAMQAIFFSSAASRPYFISALRLAQRRVDRELPGGIEQAPLGKKKILYRWEQVCFNSEMFPSGAKLSLDSLKQDVPLRVSRPKKRSYPTQQSSSCFLVLDHACQVQQQGQRDETFWVSPPSKKCSNGHILKHTE